MMYKRFFKRILDIVISFFGLIVFSPLLLITSFLVACTSKGPVIFKQDRLGKDGRVFKMYKFRSMVVGAEASGVYSDGKDKRVTKIGKIIRKTSIDELPQFINVLKGDMSFVGPRPPLTYHPWRFSEYTDEQRRMFDVRPGLTGWAQINGRKLVEWNERIRLNCWYVEHVSLKLDLKILLKTVVKLVRNADNENNGETVAKSPEVNKCR